MGCFGHPSLRGRCVRTASLVLIFVFAAVAVIDGYRGRDVKHALSVGTEESINVTRGRDRVVSFRVANTSSRHLKVRIAPDFPAVLEAVPLTCRRPFWNRGANSTGA